MQYSPDVELCTPHPLCSFFTIWQLTEHRGAFQGSSLFTENIAYDNWLLGSNMLAGRSMLLIFITLKCYQLTFSTKCAEMGAEQNRARKRTCSFVF